MSENQVKAAELFREAAEAGHPEGQFEYGLCLRDGKGVQQNLQEAKEWFRKAAVAGHTEAAHVLSQISPVASQSVDTKPAQTNQDSGIGCFVTILKVIIIGFTICFLITTSVAFWPITLIVVAVIVIAFILKKSK